MKTVGMRSIVLYILLFAFLGGVGFFLVEFFLNGNQWAMQPYNGHLYAETSAIELGSIKDRDGNLLAYTQDGQRFYSESETERRALLHTVGDPNSMIGTSVEYTMRGKLTGFNLLTGFTDTFLNRLGKDVTLTVDKDVCTAAYNALNGHNGGVIVYNYKTGDVVCKVSAPGFDPMNVPEGMAENEEYEGVYVDNTLSGLYTPGSIFKLVTAAAAMEKWPDSWSTRTYDCQGSWYVGDSAVSCLHGDAHGTQDMYEAMGNSCNVYFAQLAKDIGAAALQEKAEEMGFGKELSFENITVAESEIDLSGCTELELAWAGVGQYTVLVNPYHMMALMGAIANGGEYTQPKLVEGNDLFGGISGEDRKLVTSVEAAQLKDLMRNNVEDYYGDWMFPAGMDVCAKTGTGEVSGGQGPNCWMVGFCDSDDYPYAFAAVVEDGVGGIESAGNLIAAVLNALTQY